MDSFNRGSPVLAMAPLAVHQAAFGTPFHHVSGLGQSVHQSNHQRLVRNCRVAGRKRSRDEAAINLDPPEKATEALAGESDDEWTLGPGMVLVKKSTGYVADAGGQSGTWVEEKTAMDEALKKEAALRIQQHMAQERPPLRSHKSQRLSTSKPSASSGDTGSGSNLPAPAATETSSSPADSTSQPVVDDFTVHLGIGWSRLSGDEHIQAAARGWARYIENHYPVSSVQIRLESRGLQSYLVEAAEGFFLFAENLRQGRLVSQTSEGALQNLKTSPPVFDGLSTMEASTTPKPAPAALSSLDTAAPLTISSSTAVEMDMC